MKRFKSVLCASLITFALSSSALASGIISVGKSSAGIISVGKSNSGIISVGKAAADGTASPVDSTYVDFAGYLLMLLSTVTL